jgi:hypothetical protein
MERLEYFGKVMKVVTELMEVSDKDILGRSRAFEVVDARWMVIYLMREKGYTTKQIAPLINHPIRTINHALNYFYSRVRNADCGLGNTLAIARQQLKE